MASTPPLRVTATGFATHEVEVRGFSKLRKKHRGDDEYVASETFTVDGLDWMLCLNPDGNGDEQGYVGAFVELVTEGAAVWARVRIGLVDWSTGCADVFFSNDDDPVLFDAGNGACCDWGTGKLASWRKHLRRSRYLRRDCLRIECVVDICHFSLVFPDLPPPAAESEFTPPLEENAAVAGTFGSEEGADVFIHVGGGGDDDEPPIAAHSSVLEAYAPLFLKKHKTTAAAAAATDIAGQTATRVDVDVDDMPRAAVEALLEFAYTGSLPVVDGMGVDGYRDMFRHLLLAAERYGMAGLSAICERVLCRCIDVESAAATLAMADWHGFQKLREACLEFASHPEIYGLVRTSKGYDAELVEPAVFFCVQRELWVKYCERSGVRCDGTHDLDFMLDFDVTASGEVVYH